MRRSLFALVAALTLLLPLTLQTPEARAAGATAASPAAAMPGSAPMARVIVKFKASGGVMKALAAKPAGERAPQHAATLAQRTGLALTDGRPIGDRMQVVFAAGMSSEQLAARLAADSEVEYAEPDVRRHVQSVPNDPLYPTGQSSATPAVGQWYLRPPSVGMDAAIDAQTAWDTTMGSSSVVVAVLDTGVRFDHPDLGGKVYAGFDFVSDIPTANDGDGRDGDASDPGDWVTGSEVNTRGTVFYHCTDPDANGNYIGENSTWHGTQTAGLIGAATGNRTGMASVGRNVMVLPVRVLGKCGGFDSDILAAMLWAGGQSNSPVANPHLARIINLSLGSTGACPKGYQDTVAQLNGAGVTVVASAGNSAGLAVDAPANCTGVIAVGGVRHLGTKVGFSNVGPEVAISAPAGNCGTASGPCLYPLLTTVNTGTTTPGTTVSGANVYSDSFNYSVGTSFSAPLVAGTAALMLSVNPSLTPAQIKSALQTSARPFPTTGASTSGATACHPPNGSVQDECYCTTSTCGAGLLDVKAAVLAIASVTAPTAPLSASTTNPNVGDDVSLDGSLATVATGRSGTFEWAVSDPTIATFTSSTNASTATVKALAAGVVTVTLTVTDNANESMSASTILTVGPVTAQVTPIPAATSSSGGGALGLPWLFGLAAAVFTLRRVRLI